MKTLAKNWYVIAAVLLFMVAAAFLAIIFASYSASTSVDSTQVGNIYIGAIDNDTDRRKTLNREVNSWKKEAMYTISLQGYEVRIGRKVEDVPEKDPKTGALTGNTVKGNVEYGLTIYDFDYEATVDGLTKDEKNKCFFTINEEELEVFYNQLQTTFGKEVYEKIYLDKLLIEIEKNAKDMNTIAEIDLYDFLSTDFSATSFLSININNVEEERIEKILSKCQEIEILPQEETENKLGFSAVKYFDKKEYEDLTSDDLSVIATGLAALVQETSFTVTVKNQGLLYQKYYAYNGMTARINVKDKTDLRIINPESHAYTVKISRVSEKSKELKFSLFGCKFVNEYDVEAGLIVGDEIVYGRQYIEPVANLTYNQYLVKDKEGMKVDEGLGIYYYVLEEGIDSELISYVKKTTTVSGKVSYSYVYQKQEFYAGVRGTWEYNYLVK